jgi:sialic acid synthase SpsE
MNIEIIAELAQGFEGNVKQAMLLVNAAAAAGANAAKFQLVYADELATPDYEYYDLFQSLEMTDEEWNSVSLYAKKQKIELYFDIFGSKSLKLCEEIGINGIKLHGTDIANIGLLNEIAECTIQKVYLGAGGAHLGEIKQAISILKNKTVIVLLGFQSYPTPNKDNHIDRISVLKRILKNEFKNFQIGFADHADPTSPLRYAIASTAIGAGAQIIEKHLTLGKVMQMEDHESALNPDEFLEFTQVIRDCVDSLSKANNEDDLGMSDSEKKYRKMIRRHVVSSKDIKAGSVLKPSDIVLKRTSAENFITEISSVYNKTILEDIVSNTAISANKLKSV